MPKPPETCPNCGADVPPRGKACPECGSCDKTGWSEEADGSGLDLPGEDFDYDNFVREEFGGTHARPRNISWFWWAIAILVLLALLFLFLPH